ncbi:hypothetical protein [Cerasicoccus fimbriatus]|uniref:hypothetical protein n=1 Tax=Cerasicoccus fimbriatus TaxID=3014554 RepID=UPI0022B3DDCB|nr:hypothetical protein [Cerasicoccus sp. TK19100]
MSFDLNELRAQREKMREHLAWLDRQIAQLEGQPAPTPSKPNESLSTPEPTKTDTKPEPAVAIAAAQSAPPSPAPANDAPEAVISNDFKPGGFDGSSKLGCILAAIFLAGLIIFLLFGLPQLLYPDAPQ